MIVMPVGDDHGVYCRKVYPQFFRVFQKGAVRACVHQKLVGRGLHILRKAVNGSKAFAAGGIFH